MKNEGNLNKMPTIIERIAAAEADADTLKRNAQEAARTAVAQAEDDAAASLRIAREEEKAGLALAAAMANAEAENEAVRRLNAGSMRSSVIIGGASKKLENAVALILGEIGN